MPSVRARSCRPTIAAPRASASCTSGLAHSTARTRRTTSTRCCTPTSAGRFRRCRSRAPACATRSDRSRGCTRWSSSAPRRARASSARSASCWSARPMPTRHSRASPRAIRASSRSPSPRKATASTRSNQLDLANADIVHDLAQSRRSRAAPSAGSSKALRRRRAQGVPPFAVLSCDNLPDNGTGPASRAGRVRAQLSDAGPRALDRSRSGLPAHHGRQHHAGHRRRAAQARTGTHRRGRRVADSARAVHAMGHRGPAGRCATRTGSRSASRSRRTSASTTAPSCGCVNGPHSTLTYLGLLRGHESVADAMRDEQLAQFVELLMTEDLAPSLGDNAGLRRRALHLRGAGALPQSRHPSPAEPDRLGRLEETAGAHHR